LHAGVEGVEIPYIHNNKAFKAVMSV